MRGEKQQYGHIDILVQMAIYLFLLNALCKYFLPNSITKILPIFALILVAFRSNSPFKFKISGIDIPICAFLFVWFIGCFYSPAVTKGLGYVLSFAIAFLFGIYLCGKNINEYKVMKLLSIICSVFALFIVIQPIVPELVSSVNHLFSYQAQEYMVMEAWTRNGWYSGLFPDRAPAAFFCCILVGSGLYYLYYNHDVHRSIIQKIIGIFCIIFGVYGIMMTAKRGLLIGTAIAAFISYVVYKKSNKAPVWKICIAVAIAVVIVWLVFNNLAVTKVMMQRFFDNDDIMTGRTIIYANMYKYIWNSPLFGNGTASAFNLLGIGGHNIYLTILLENGVIGLFTFALVVIYSIFLTIRLILKFGNYSYRSCIPFLLFSLYIQVFFLVYGMSGNPLYDNYILYFYLFAIFIVKNLEYRFENFKRKEV